MVILGIVIVGVAALVAFAKRPDRSAGVQRELDALRQSSEARGGSAAAKRSAAEPRLCGELDRTTLGKVSDGSLHELSGLVLSRRDAHVLWAIQDSGNAPELIALRTNGTLIGRWTVAGASNFDWEDIATGPGGPGGVPWLYAADLGDNLAQRDDIVIYRVPEPTSPGGGGTTAPASALHLTYPDGAHDAESFLVDPKRGTLIVVTKGVPGGVYALSKPSSWSGTHRLHKVADAALAYATAADVSANGRVIALRGYFSGSFWTRRGNEPLTATLRRKPCTSPTGLDDGQGESIALSPLGSTAWIVAEGKNPPIHRLTPR